MLDKCKHCPLLFCDFVSRDCRLTSGEVARLRPDLLRDDEAAIKAALSDWSKAMNALRKPKPFTPQTGMAIKYDRRRKKDSPRRQWERKYRRERRLCTI